MRLERIADVPLLSSPHTVELTPDGTALVCAASALFVCDLSGTITRTLRKASRYGVTAMFVTPEGRIVAKTAATMRAWSARTGALEEELEPTILGYHRLTSVSRDGRRILTTTRNKSFTVWDLSSKQALATRTEKRSIAAAAALSADGGTIAYGGTDGIVRFYDVASQAPRGSSPGKGWIEVVVASSDGRFFASGGRAGIVFVWNLDGSLHTTLSYGSKITGIALSPDARFLVAHGTHAAPAMWDLETSAQVATLDHHPTRSVRFSRNGECLVTMGNDCRACVAKIV